VKNPVKTESNKAIKVNNGSNFKTEKNMNTLSTKVELKTENTSEANRSPTVENIYMNSSSKVNNFENIKDENILSEGNGDKIENPTNIVDENASYEGKKSNKENNKNSEVVGNIEIIG
jgi:hypothetical protein